MGKRSVALLYDEYIGPLKTLTTQYRHAFTETGMKAVVDSPIDSLIPGSMTLLRPAPAKPICVSPSHPP